ncbi:MAG: hypothetical protein ACK5MW_06330 [Enterococcus sp.]
MSTYFVYGADSAVLERSGETYLPLLLVQVFFLILVWMIMIAEILQKQRLTSRVVAGGVYSIVCLWCTNVILYRDSYTQFWQLHNTQTAMFILETILFCLLIKNDFKKTFYLLGKE